jgi:acetyl-CoA synthetase
MVMFEGVPTYPGPARFWEIIDKYQVNTFYTAPTAIRALMGLGDDVFEHTSRKSLKVLGTVGEPINKEAYLWYQNVIGHGCPVVDTYWQTETGAHMLTVIPGVAKATPGVAGLPLFGIIPGIMKDGVLLEGPGDGDLVINYPWPSIARTVNGNHDRYVKTYFAKHPGMYFTGDGAKRLTNGEFKITGREDDVVIVSGHNLSSAEIEEVLGSHPLVAEAAVVGKPHDIKGNSLYAYITPMNGVAFDDALKAELNKLVREKVGPIASIDQMQSADVGLPKTRSGKIMRRILRKIAEGEKDYGDISTLAEPQVVEKLAAGRVQA